jgi:two-component system, OmpR family, response regulator
VIKIKILIIDDEIDYCDIMKSYFNEKNYDVSLAFTLQEGLSMIGKIHPDIIFLDNNLPDGQGWKCVDEIVEKYPQIRIYLISAYRQKSDFVTSSPNITVWEKPISLATLNTVFV